MCNVYSFSGFARVLIKNKIPFSIRDFLDDKKVDELIQKLINVSCGKYSYVGAGIERSCFVDYRSECAIKVDKDYYTSYEDEDARSNYEEDLYYQHCNEIDDYWVDGGWEIDRLHEITKVKYCCDQNAAEIHVYQHFMKEKSELLDYIPRLYAISSNKCVEIMEACGGCGTWPSQEDYGRFKTICEHFDDTHDGNFGINRAGKLVILDIGFSTI